MFKAGFHVNIHSIFSQEEFSGEGVGWWVNRGLFELRPISPMTAYMLIGVKVQFIINNNRLQNTLKRIGNYANS